ncbi:heterokaryon incompatibility protein-domain-containing protein [Rostrohypoxylon terebratum]|nr:heterokaryon incompatibility protein-domain-containing protein [Rostrohypoxylon terebratum]
MDCDRCQIWAQLQDIGAKIVLHRNITDLINGIRYGCWWCIRILKHLQDDFKSLPDSLQGHPSDITYEATSEPSFEFLSFACLKECQGRTWELTVYFEINGKSDALGASLFLTKPRRQDVPAYAHTVEDNTGSQQTWDYITHRLKNCEVNHKSCRQTSSFLPSRLIEIREGGDGLHFRLIHTLDSDVRSPYITLSHRWGTNVTVQLTSQELPYFKVEISRQRMPQKYIDAAVVALRLKIPYLWIDSLCIIQDSEDDWNRESGMMSQVYRRAYCNLAATSAINNSEGLFYRRSSLQLCPHMVNLPKIGQQWIYNFNDRHHFRNLDTEPLNRRGWVCQERLLATRNISFTQQLVFFECAEELSCETMNSSEAPAGIRFDMFCRGLWSLASLENMPFEDAQIFWYEILKFYSSTNITIASDKLVAISGIARFCQPVLKSDYLAGLWIVHFIRDLCWYSENSLGHVRDYRAPSWSWASVNGIINFRYIGEYKELVGVVGTHITLVDQTNPYGAVDNSWIRFSGLVFPMFHKGCDSCEYRQRRIYEGSSFIARAENFIEEALDGWAILAQIDSYALKISSPRDLSQLEPVDCFLFPIACENDEGYYTEPRLYFLILAAITPSRGTYQRIGLLEVQFYLMNETHWATSESSPKENPQNSEEMAEYVLLLLKNKFQHCQVPSFEGHKLHRHEITLV